MVPRSAVASCVYTALVLDSFGGARGLSRFLPTSYDALAGPYGACTLPNGARWCTAISGDKQWRMAVYESEAAGNGAGDTVSEKICEDQFWEFPTPEAMGVAPGASTFLDIGANIGWFSIMFAKHGFKVVAVEPMTSNREMIHATLCMNPELAERIEIKAVALTDVDVPGKMCSIYSREGNLGNGVLACNDEELTGKYQTWTSKDTHVREQVPLMTLNSVLANSSVRGFDVVKLDVEEHECAVLAGGRKLFTDHHPKQLALEVWPSTVNCTIPFIKQFGDYTVHKRNFTGPIIEPTAFDHWGQMVGGDPTRDLFLAMR